jgi:hypothetical protein
MPNLLNLRHTTRTRCASHAFLSITVRPQCRAVHCRVPERPRRSALRGRGCRSISRPRTEVRLTHRWSKGDSNSWSHPERQRSECATWVPPLLPVSESRPPEKRQRSAELSATASAVATPFHVGVPNAHTPGGTQTGRHEPVARNETERLPLPCWSLMPSSKSWPG